jgi:hypothetical protein
MSTRRPITIWSLLALLAVLIGGPATILSDQSSLRKWARSGIWFPVGETCTVELPEGSTLVYYESMVDVPLMNADLIIHDRPGQYIYQFPAPDENSFRLTFGNWQGASLWELRLEQPETIDFTTRNDNDGWDPQVYSEDRIVFLKEPQTLAEVKSIRKRIQITGASITIGLAVVLYIVHGIALYQRGRPAATRKPTKPSTGYRNVDV